jgi:Ni,Fe-hydrogenase III small subunit/NAD-dependent dihydropyrimidine dehydrogenase PreA subunit
MLKVIRIRKRQGYRTADFPAEEPVLPDRFRGRPAIDGSRCREGCRACAEACPTDAIERDHRGPAIDLGRCLFCTACADACGSGAIAFEPEYRLATSTRADLRFAGGDYPLAAPLAAEIRRLYGRALRLREVSAGGCNGCEADVNVLSTLVFDLSRFGVQIVASPRHADGIIVTGPVSTNMREALRMTWDAVAAPKFAIAVGACAISGGPFAGHDEVALGGAADVVPIDLFIPGCPPHPYTILDGILRVLGRRGDEARS